MRQRKKITQTSSINAPDWTVLLLVIILVIFGAFMVYNASVVEAYTLFADKFHFIKLQLMWAGLGLVGLLVATFIPLKFVQKYSHLFFLLTIFLLMIVLIPGIGTKVQGARRWLITGPIRIQPAELIKLSAALYLPTLFIKRQSFKRIGVLIAFVIGLIMLEPDLGTTIVFVSSALITYFLSGAPLKHFIFLFLTGVGLAAALIVSSPYRMNRLTTFFNPQNDPLGKSYHIRQVLIGIGSGGLTGQGLGRSRQKYQYLPEATTDSIFAVIAEEVGFVGASLVILLYIIIIFRLWQIVINTPELYMQLIGSSLVSFITVQVMVNLSAMVALIPLTGVPLPFISYGGSSLITALTSIGFILNISRHKKQ